MSKIRRVVPDDLATVQGRLDQALRTAERLRAMLQESDAVYDGGTE